MTAVYVRTAEQRQNDFRVARDFEQEVAAVLPPHAVTNFDATDELDIQVPGYHLEIKERRQRLTPRWHLLPGVPEEDLFVIDELTVRRALKHYPYAYILVRDVPGERLFIGSIAEWVVVERVRVSRAGKAKLVVDLRNFRQLDRLEQLHEFVVADIACAPWRTACALSPVLTVMEV